MVETLTGPGGCLTRHYHAPATPDGGGGLLATVIDRTLPSPGIEFVTDPADPLQVATMCHPPGHVVRAHWHPPVPRQIARTTEVLVVTAGSAVLDLYGPANDELLHSVEIGPRHVVILYGSGHGVRVREGHIPFCAVEVKQGPYPGAARDKVMIGEGS